MVICAGIAIPEIHWDDDSNTRHDDVWVHLGVTATGLVDWTGHAGLASVTEDDSAFLFAVDTLDLQLPNEELILVARTALQGSSSAVSRFGYHITAIIEAKATAIRGEVRWAKDLNSSGADNLVAVSANYQVPATDPGPSADPSMPSFGTSPQYIPFAWASLESPVDQGNDFVVRYGLTAMPYGVPIYVEADITPAFGSGYVQQTSGPRPVVLTNTVPEVDGVNFRVEPPTIVH